MNYTEADLEEILSIALERVPSAGINPEDFTNLYRTAVGVFNQAKAADVNTLYQNLSPSSWFVEAFQMSTKGYKIEKPRMWSWKPIKETVKRIFDAKISEFAQDEPIVYLWLEKLQNDGIIECYGTSHRDGCGRMNMHYFSVTADYDSLNLVVQTFKQNPKHLSLFAKTVFGWENKVDNGNIWGQVDLFQLMKELQVYIPNKGIERIKI